MAGEGTGKDTGTVPGNDTPSGTGASGGGGGGGENKPSPEGGATGAAKEFDRGKLHPVLRDMSPEEMTELFETMSTSLRTIQSGGRNGAIDTSGVPEHARRPEPKKPEPVAKETYKELLDPDSEKFDPEQAFKMYAERNYGQLFGDVNLRSIRGMYGQFRDQLPDFKDYEQEVTDSLQRTIQAGKPASQLTESDVLNTYFLVKGAKVTLKERQANAGKSTTTVAPSAPVIPEKKPELSEVELEVADRMFRRIPDRQKRIEEYKKFAGYEDGMTMKVPVGGGKVE